MTDDVVAVLGAGGTMGLPMARNLARAGIKVRAWNRSREKAKPLERDGATVCDTPAQPADGADVLLTMLADANTVLQSASAALAHLADAAIWLQMSTIGESGTERCAQLADEHEIAFLDAPVLGSKQPAAEGKLVVLASGPQEMRSRIQAVFDAVGHRTMWARRRQRSSAPMEASHPSPSPSAERLHIAQLERRGQRAVALASDGLMRPARSPAIDCPRAARAGDRSHTSVRGRRPTAHGCWRDPWLCGSVDARNDLDDGADGGDARVPPPTGRQGDGRV